MKKPLKNIFGRPIICRGVRVDVCINRRPSISACNQHNFMMFISKCSFLQKDYKALSHEIVTFIFNLGYVMIEIVRYLKCHTYQNLAILLIYIP